MKTAIYFQNLGYPQKQFIGIGLRGSTRAACKQARAEWQYPRGAWQGCLSETILAPIRINDRAASANNLSPSQLRKWRLTYPWLQTGHHRATWINISVLAGWVELSNAKKSRKRIYSLRRDVVVTVKQRHFFRIEGGEGFFDKRQKCRDLRRHTRRLAIHGEDGKARRATPVSEHLMQLTR